MPFIIFKTMMNLPSPLVSSEKNVEHATRLEVTVADAAKLQEKDIKVVYHPSSGKPYEIIFQRAYQKKVKAAQEAELNREPWHEIFGNQNNFELAEFALEASLNEDLTNKLFKIIGCIHDRTSQLTYTSACQLNKA